MPKEETTRRGTVVRIPDALRLIDRSPVTDMRRGFEPGVLRRSLDQVGDSEDAALTAALLAGIVDEAGAEGVLLLHDAFDLDPELTDSRPSGRRRIRTAVPFDTRPVTVEVKVNKTELAALLVEQDGIYAWRLPETSSDGAARRRSADGQDRLTFRLDEPSADQVSAFRRGLIDWVTGGLKSRVRAIVVKWVAAKAVDCATDYLERKVVTGLIAFGKDDPETWRAHPPSLDLPSDRPARLLLLVHGTFSSTRGSFGVLSLTPEGQTFLTEARKHYDAIVAFDHKTLSETPQQNAEAILGSLKTLQLPAGTSVDIIAFSRGGLVARVLIERLLEKEGWPVTPERVAFVGCTNGGTALANQENWKALLDLYTNLAVVAGRGLAMFDAGTASTIVAESVKTLGDLLRAIVDTAITQEMVPGLAAMSPKSALVAELNGPLTHADEKQVRYYVVGSDFEPKLFEKTGTTTTLSTKLMRALADFGVDALMRKRNDLVVDTEAMMQFGDLRGRLVDRRLWDANTTVLHTNYFIQPEVTQVLQRWLLGEQRIACDAAKVEAIETISADMVVSQARERLEQQTPGAAIVIQRGDTDFYVRTAGTILSAVRDASPDNFLGAVLDLHEDQQADRAEGDAPASSKIGTHGWVRIKNGSVVEAVPPPTPQPYSERRVSRRGSPSEKTRPGKAADRRSRAAPAAPSTATTAEPIKEVSCHFAAEMKETVPLAKPAALTVTVSREQLEKVLGPTVATGRAFVRLREPITLMVQTRANCQVLDPKTRQPSSSVSVEVRVPDEGRPETYDFELIGKTAGPAELWVDAHQGARRLARMVLQPNFVSDGKIRAASTASTQATDPPLVELRIYENADTPDARFSLRFVMESRDLGILIDEETGRFSQAREPYIASIYATLEGEWGRNGDDFERFMRQLRAFGGDLYNNVVPKTLREAIWQHRNDIGSIEVISHEPFIPWEVLHLVEPGKRIPPNGNMFLAELGLIRWINNAGWPPAALKIDRGRARHVIPDYNPTDQRACRCSSRTGFTRTALREPKRRPRKQ